MKRLLLCGLAVSLLVSGCDVFVRNTGVHPVTRAWQIRVHNDTGEVFEVDLDGRFLATVTPGTSVQAEVLEGFHRLEAWDSRGVLRAEREFYLDSDFLWVLER